MDKINFILSNLPDLYNKNTSSNLYNTLNPIAGKLDEFISQIDEVKNSRFIDTSTGTDLERIALLVNLKRFNNESDESFRSRIKSRVQSFIGGGTNDALKQVVTNYLGVEPIIIEHYLPNEGHPYFDKGVINGLETSVIDSSNLKVSKGTAYLNGIRYSLNDSTVTNQDGYLKYNFVYSGTNNKTNFVNKVSGDLTANPNTMLANGGNTIDSSLLSPSNRSSFGELSSYTYVTTQNNVTYATTKIINTAISQHLFQFNIIEQIERNICTIPGTTLTDKITWLNNNINSIIVNWYGFGSTILNNPTQTTNFVNKIAGSTVENANIAKWGSNTSLMIPSYSGWSEFGQSSAQYTSIYTQDGTCARIGASTNGVYAEALFSFNLIEYVQRKYNITVPGTATTDKVTWLKNNISTLTCNAYIYGSGPNGNKAYLQPFNIGSGTYDNLDTLTNTSSTPTLISRKLPYAHSFNSYIDSNGFINFLAYTDPSDGVTTSTINIDYVSLDVTMVSGGNKASLSPWYVTNSGWGSAYTNTSSSSTELTISISSINNYIDSNGFVNILAYADASNGLYPSTINTDYIELSITMKDVTPYITNENNNTILSNQILLSDVQQSVITDMRNILDPEEHYITNTASITLQIPYDFTVGNIPLEDVKNILRHTKAAGIALLIKIMDTYKDSIQITDSVGTYFLVGYSGMGSNNLLGGIT